MRVDHRTLESQGIHREPTTHVGPAVSALERHDIETELGKRIAWQRQAAAQERLERAAASPSGAKKSVAEIRAEARQRWLAERELARARSAQIRRAAQRSDGASIAGSRNSNPAEGRNRINRPSLIAIRSAIAVSTMTIALAAEKSSVLV